jgi:L-rhamnose mutarotase
LLDSRPPSTYIRPQCIKTIQNPRFTAEDRSRRGRHPERVRPAVAAAAARERTVMQRVCFQLQVKPDRVDEYTRRHAEVWPEMLEALRDAGWTNYSLFLGARGLLIGYVETESLAAAQAGMADTTVNARWQAEMAEFFVDLDGAPDQGFLQLREVFNLDDQLDRAARS